MEDLRSHLLDVAIHLGEPRRVRVERLNAVASASWMEMLKNAVAPVTLPSEAESAFYRITGQ